LFEEKPVLLRLTAELTRQWINTTCQFLERLDVDLQAMRLELLGVASSSRVDQIEGKISDPHNAGQSVVILHFEDGLRAVYKPKDLRPDAAWHALVERLNRDGAPIELRAMRTLVRGGYGWTEFIEHVGCVNVDACNLFFRRSGGWLALFHSLAATDMHQENKLPPVIILFRSISKPSSKRVLSATVERSKLKHLRPL
jgi:lantibiotic modifying enzyme